MRTFFELFARSPFEPLARHGEKVNEVLKQLPTLMDAFLDEDWARTRELHESISRLEHVADEIKQEIRDHLPKSLFLPVDRGDLLRYLKEQDAIADTVEDLAVLVSMRETRAPDSMKPSVRDLVAKIIQAGQTWAEISSMLPSLQASSFTGPEVQKVLDLSRTLSHQEFEADQLQATVARAAVRHEEELGAVSFWFWMRISNTLGEVANHGENTADLLRLMLAKS